MFSGLKLVRTLCAITCSFVIFGLGGSGGMGGGVGVGSVFCSPEGTGLLFVFVFFVFPVERSRCAAGDGHPGSPVDKDG
jgi:hypothetical protein